MTTPKTATPLQGDLIAKAIESADWSNTPIGNKALLKAACAALRTAATRDDAVREALISAGCTSRNGTVVYDSMDRVLAALQGAKP